MVLKTSNISKCNDKDDNFGNKIESIELLRIIAALGVALSHIGCWDFVGLRFPLGVNLLFCISSFLMMLTTEKQKKHFLIHRMLRILPLYWLLTLATFAAAKTLPGVFGVDTASIAELVKSLFLIPYIRAGLKTSVVIRPIVGPGWTMYYDVCFAILFTVAMKISHKHRGLLTVFFCSSLMLCSLLSDTNLFLHVYTKAYWLDFIAGIAIYYIWKMYRKNKKRLAANKYLRICSGIAAFVGLAFLYTHKQMYLLDAFACGVILLGSMIFFDGRHFPKAVPVLGGLSYAFYLVHYYVILILSKFFNLTGWTAAAVTLLAIVLSYVAAWCANQLIERKFTNWLERKIFMQD